MENTNDDEDGLSAASITGASKTFTIDLGDLKTPQKQKRRSWFTPGLAPDVEGITIETEVLVLDHFLRPPRVDFGSSVPGKCKMRRLVARNPRPYDQTVAVEKAPDKQGFAAVEQTVLVPANGEVTLTLTWLPASAGDYRGKFQYLVDGRYRVEAVVFGKACDLPQPPAKGKRRPWVRSQPAARPLVSVQNVLQAKQHAGPAAVCSAATAAAAVTGAGCHRPAAAGQTITLGIQEHCTGGGGSSIIAVSGGSSQGVSDTENVQPRLATAAAADVQRIDVLYSSPVEGVASLSAMVRHGKTGGSGSSSGRKKKGRRRSHTYSKTVVTAWLAGTSASSNSSTPRHLLTAHGDSDKAVASSASTPVASISQTSAGAAAAAALCVRGTSEGVTTPLSQAEAAAAVLARVTCSIDTPMRMAGCLSPSPRAETAGGASFVSTLAGTSCSGMSLSAVVSPDSFLRDTYSPSASSARHLAMTDRSSSPTSPAQLSLSESYARQGVATASPAAPPPSSSESIAPCRAGDEEGRSAAGRATQLSAHREKAMSSRQVALRALIRGRERERRSAAASPKQLRSAASVAAGSCFDTPTRHVLMASGSLGGRFDMPDDEPGTKPTDEHCALASAAAILSLKADEILLSPVGSSIDVVATPELAHDGNEEWLSPPSASRVRNFPVVQVPAAVDSPRRVTYDVDHSPAAAATPSLLSASFVQNQQEQQQQWKEQPVDSMALVCLDGDASASDPMSCNHMPPSFSVDASLTSQLPAVAAIATLSQSGCAGITGQEPTSGLPPAAPVASDDDHNNLLESTRCDAVPTCGVTNTDFKAPVARFATVTKVRPSSAAIVKIAQPRAPRRLILDDACSRPGTYDQSGGRPADVSEPPRLSPSKRSNSADPWSSGQRKALKTGPPMGDRRNGNGCTVTAPALVATSSQATLKRPTARAAYVPKPRLGPSGLTGNAAKSHHRRLVPGKLVLVKPNAVLSQTSSEGCEAVEKPPTEQTAFKAGIAAASGSAPPTVFVRHLLPFAGKNTFYDELWMEKREHAFARWLNHVLTPTLHSTGSVAAAAAAAEAAQSSLASGVPPAAPFQHAVPPSSCDAPAKACQLAPSRESLSLSAHEARRQLDALRRRSCQLYQSSDVAAILGKVEAEVESQRLVIRRDRHLRSDVGLKQKLVNMLLSYNPLWLRVGLETVYGEMLCLAGNADSAGLTRFLTTRLLCDPGLAVQYGHPTVPHLYRAGYDEALSRHLLKKFLLLVYFLDRAKLARLIDYDPCLFRKDAAYKSSRDLLLTFSSEYLAGEGDITKHLGYHGYKVYYVQAALDEFDYAVRNLATDLRDGIRLTRVLEMLTRDWTLTKRLRLPAVSRLQRIHNVSVALKAAAAHGLDVLDTLEARDVVDGHREKTLCLLWRIIAHFQFNTLIDLYQLQDEVARLLHTADKQPVSVEKTGKAEGEEACDLRAALLLQWCRLVGEQHGVIPVENFTSSFADGRLLCTLVHHYQPSLIADSEIRSATLTALAASAGRDASEQLCSAETLNELLQNEKHNLELVNARVAELGAVPVLLRVSDVSNTLPDEKAILLFVAYLCSRLLSVRHEARAARTVQAAWRAYVFRRLLPIKTAAAVRIQGAYRRHRFRSDLRLHVAELKASRRREQAAVVLQRASRRFLCALRKRRMADVERQNMAALRVQSWWRMHRSAAKHRLQQEQRRHEVASAAATSIQAWWRALRCRSHYLRVRTATVKLQTEWRAWHYQRVRRRQQEAAATTIQRWWRALQCRALYQRKRSATIVLQSAWRMHRSRTVYRRQRAAALRIESWWRARRALALHRRRQAAAVVMQSRWRGRRCRAVYIAQQAAAVRIQSWWRSALCWRAYRRLREAAVAVQAWWRALRCRAAYQRLRQATVTIQSWWRMRQCRSRYARQRLAAIRIQSWWLMCMHRTEYSGQRCAAVKIQSWWRMHACKASYERQRSAAVKIQSGWRARLCRAQYAQQRSAAIKVQAWWRRCRCAGWYGRQRRAAVTIQSWWRKRIRHVRCTQSATRIQSWWRANACRARYRQWKQAAVTIQTSWRARSCSSRYNSMRGAAVRIQSWWRANACRARYRQWKQAAVTIQTSWRARSCSSRYKSMRRAAVRIQSWWRMLVCRAGYERARSAALTIQAWWRMHERLASYKRQRLAATTIQSWWRMCLVRVAFGRQRRAAIALQSWWRMECCRVQHERLRSAALTVQSWWRGRLQRGSYGRQRAAAATIQTWWRMARCRAAYVRLRLASVTIQSWWRALCCRALYARQRCAAIAIQSWWRGRRCRALYGSQRSAAVTIQRRWRQTLLHRAELRRQWAAVIIQSHCRSWLSCRAYERQRRAAALVGQRWRLLWRRRAELATALQWRLEQQQQQRRWLDSAVALQACWGMHEQRAAYERQLAAATRVIQAWWRAVRARRQRVAAASLVQAWWRTRRSRRRAAAAELLQRWWRMVRCRQNFRRQKHAVARIESWYGRLVTARRNEAAAVIQLWYRGWRACRAVRRAFLIRRGAVITIQSYVRGFLVRQRMQALEAAATVIQANVRCFLEQRRYAVVCGAVVTIQAAFRGCLARRGYLLHLGAIITLQRAVRTWIHRRRCAGIAAAARAEVAAATTIQRHWRLLIRGRKDRDSLLCLRAAAITIQRAWRRRHLIRIHSVTALQRWYRAILARRFEKAKVATRRPRSAATEQHRLMTMLQTERSASTTVKAPSLALPYESSWGGFDDRGVADDWAVRGSNECIVLEDLDGTDNYAEQQTGAVAARCSPFANPLPLVMTSTHCFAPPADDWIGDHAQRHSRSSTNLCASMGYGSNEDSGNGDRKHSPALDPESLPAATPPFRDGATDVSAWEPSGCITSATVMVAESATVADLPSMQRHVASTCSVGLLSAALVQTVAVSPTTLPPSVMIQCDSSSQDVLSDAAQPGKHGQFVTLKKVAYDCAQHELLGKDERRDTFVVTKRHTRQAVPLTTGVVPPTGASNHSCGSGGGVLPVGDSSAAALSTANDGVARPNVSSAEIECESAAVQLCCCPCGDDDDDAKAACTESEPSACASDPTCQPAASVLPKVVHTQRVQLPDCSSVLKLRTRAPRRRVEPSPERIFIGLSPEQPLPVASRRGRPLPPSSQTTPSSWLSPGRSAEDYCRLSWLLRYKDVGRLLEVLHGMAAAAEASPDYRSHAVSSGLAGDLITLAGCCNRSVPHIEVVSACTQLLLMLAEDGATVASVWPEVSAMSLIDLLAVYGPLSTTAFRGLCRLLVQLASAAEDSWKQKVLRDSFATQKLVRLHAMTLHKAELLLRQTCKSRVTAPSSALSIQTFNHHHQQQPLHGRLANTPVTACKFAHKMPVSNKRPAAVANADAGGKEDDRGGGSAVAGTGSRPNDKRLADAAAASAGSCQTPDCLDVLTRVLQAFGLP